MDISGVSAAGAVNAALAQKEVYSQQNVQVSVFKKVLDIQTQGALALIESLPNISSNQGLPSNLGNTINTTA